MHVNRRIHLKMAWESSNITPRSGTWLDRNNQAGWTMAWNNPFKRVVKSFLAFGRGLLDLLRKRELVCVYNIGKVGSQSILHQIQASGQSNVIFFHFLFLLRRQRPVQYILFRLYRALGRPIKIICPVREPVARNISAFAHDFSSYFFKNRRFAVRRPMQEFSTDELVDLFEQWDRHDLNDRWFQDEFEPQTGIDVFQFPFDRDKGYRVIEMGSVEVLLLRSELGDGVKSRVLAELLGRELPPSERRNTFKDRSYKGGYEAFRDAMLKDQAYRDRIYRQRYARHFYG